MPSEYFAVAVILTGKVIYRGTSASKACDSWDPGTCLARSWESASAAAEKAKAMAAEYRRVDPYYAGGLQSPDDPVS